MTNKIIVIAVIVALVAGLFFLEHEVKGLRGEVAQLTQTLASKPKPDSAPVQQQTPVPRQVMAPMPGRAARHMMSSRPYSGRSPLDTWDPYDEFAQIQSQMNQLLGRAFQGRSLPRASSLAGGVYGLNTDIKDAKDKYVIDMDLPGMDKQNINVEVKNNVLLISGERKDSAEEKDNNYYSQERSFGYFSQSLPLPEDADSSAITVRYEKGVLRVEIPKLTQSGSEPQKSEKIKVE